MKIDYYRGDSHDFHDASADAKQIARRRERAREVIRLGVQPRRWVMPRDLVKLGVDERDRDGRWVGWEGHAEFPADVERPADILRAT